MYSIYADNLLIFSDITPAEEVKVVDPKLSLADSAAGSLTMTLPPSNAGYSYIQRLTTDIIVQCDGEEIWRGRVLNDEYDFWKRRKLTCEGELAFLNDTIQPPHKYESQTTTIRNFLESLISIHNSKVSVDKQFMVGSVTVNDGDQLEDDDSIYRFTNYETTLECINDKLVSKLGGHIRVRHYEGIRYIDYISDENIGANSQIIRFGENLTDFVKKFDMSELCTVIVPRGERLEEEEIEGLEAYLTVKDCEQTSQHDAGSIYVKSPEQIARFGWIEAVVDFENVTVKENLYSKAVKYLSDEQFDKMTLEIKAVDLHYLSGSTQRIRMLDKLRCISLPHGMDHTFPITKMDISLDKPTDSLYTLGTDATMTLTQATTKSMSNVNYELERIPSKSDILKSAQENAFNLIMSSMKGSYVHLVTNAEGVLTRIETTDGPTYNKAADLDNNPNTDPFPDSLNRLIMDYGGIGHIGRSNYQTQWPAIGNMNVALMINGSIVADRITTGVMYADRIKGGTLQVGHVPYNGQYRDGVVSVLNSNGVEVVKLDYAGLYAIAGKIDGYLEIGPNGRLGSFGTGDSMDGVCVRRGSLGVSIGPLDNGSWAGLTFGYETTEHCDWDAHCAVLFTGGHSSGGFHVTNDAPGNSNHHISSMTVQRGQSFQIYRSSDMVANFDESHYREWNGASDRRLKDNIEDIDTSKSFKFIMSLRPVSFTFNELSSIEDKTSIHSGFIAQEVKDIIDDDDGIVNVENDLYYLKYYEIIPHLVNVIQKQQEEIDFLKEEIQTIKERKEIK